MLWCFNRKNCKSDRLKLLFWVSCLNIIFVSPRAYIIFIFRNGLLRQGLPKWEPEE